MSRLWAVVPAAGVGSRMGSAIPKQYLPLHGAQVIDLTLSRLLAIEGIERILVATSDEDAWWPDTRSANHSRVERISGGKERSESVFAGLEHLLSSGISADEWVLVHDAARPCVRLDDIQRLIRECLSGGIGGILGMPVTDTMKIADREGCINFTQPRENLWHAFTPQMFRLGMLHDAIARAHEQDIRITDEASAMEADGHHPKLVEGHGDNIKITRPADLALAEFYLSKE